MAMLDRVTSIQARVEISLNDASKTKIVIPLDTVGNTHNLVNYITKLSGKMETNSRGTNPVGVVSSNTATIELTSNDKMLVPENTKSTYYGYMDETALAYIYLTLDGVDLPYGKYYVNSWRNVINETSPNKIVIEAADLLSVIRKNAVPFVDITTDLTIKQYFIEVLNKLNSKSNSRHKIEFDEADITFGPFQTMQFSNLDTSDMSRLLDTLSQSTLTNIYIDADNKLKTDYCGDDTANESVAKLSDAVNIINFDVKAISDTNYTGIKVGYVEGIVNDSAQVTKLDKQTLKIGDNQFNNIELGNGVYKVNYVSVIVDDDSYEYISKQEYNKMSLSSVINSSIQTTGNIEVYGQTVNQSKAFIYRYIDTKNNNSLLELTNTFLYKSDIELFADELIKIMRIKNGRASVKGKIDPRIGLCNTVEVELNRSGITKFCKVISKEWNVTNTIDTTMELLNVIG